MARELPFMRALLVTAAGLAVAVVFLVHPLKAWESPRSSALFPVEDGRVGPGNETGQGSQTGPFDRAGQGTQNGSGLFDSEEPLKIVLEADFTQLRRDRDQDSRERRGALTVVGSAGFEVKIPLKVKTRGRFRLQEKICPDPPLRLNFPNPTPYGTLFDGQDKLKLVTHCRDDEAFEQNLLEEYLAYRVYNQITDVSFRVRLVQVTYRDTEGTAPPMERLGFLIEDEDVLAARLGGGVVEVPGIYPNQFDMEQIGLLYLYYFLIGNVDWGTAGGHNVKIVQKEQTHFPVPYDFDFSGFVDAPYAKPSELTQSLHDSVRERLYRGVCMPGVDYQGAFAQFNRARESIMALVQNQTGLSPENRASAREYLEEFYLIINDPDKAESEVIQACRPWL